MRGLKGNLSKLELTACAKVNIGWEVGETRADGFHEVQGTIQTVSLSDTLTISPVHNSVEGTVTLDVPNYPELENENNLIVAATNLLLGNPEAGSKKLPATNIVLTKRIPIGSGLGGGSADAAAALVGLNAFWKLGLSARQLLALAAELGSDVPAILLGGFVHCGGKGERVRSLGVTHGYEVVIVCPDHRLSTPTVYNRFDEMRPPTRGRLSLEQNDLEPAAKALVTEIDVALDHLRTRGASSAFVSGSGPATVGVFTDGRGADVAQQISNENPAWFVTCVAPTNCGVRMNLGSEAGIGFETSNGELFQPKEAP